MMRHPTFWALGILLLAAAAPVRAQAPGTDRPRLEELRRRVRERYTERVRQELDLTDDQMRRLRTTVGDYGARRRDMEARQRALQGALVRQLRPGIAASRDSVARLTDELMALRVRYAESFRGEQADMARYLDPVQRAKITVLRERLLNRAQELGRRRPFMERRVQPE
jgi:Spy/CpxP family protein refolding chaperone